MQASKQAVHSHIVNMAPMLRCMFPWIPPLLDALRQVTEETTGRQFAMKRMSKVAAMQCPDHVFCEQRITRNMAHPFCIRQYASFKVRGFVHIFI